MWIITICAYSSLLILTSAFVAGLSAYLFILTISACYRILRTKNSNPAPQKEQAANFIILIPVHNEQDMLGHTLDHLLSLNYPREKMETIVIADHCSDHTTQIAQQKGCAVLERTDKNKTGKNRALNWAMERHLRDWPRDYDAVLFIDVDSHLHQDFIWHMNEELQKGNKLLQGYNTVVEEGHDWRAAIQQASAKLRNYLRPLGRQGLGLPCGLRGNGFVISRQLIEKYGYPTHSNLEDIELALFYKTKNVDVTFVPAARVHEKRPRDKSAESAWGSAWHHDRVAVIRKWFPRLLKQTLAKQDWSSLDSLLELIIPPFSPLLSTSCVLVALTVIGTAVIPGVLPYLAQYLMLVAIASQFIYLLAGLAMTQTSREIWKGVILAPAFMLRDAYQQLRAYIQSPDAERVDDEAREDDDSQD